MIEGRSFLFQAEAGDVFHVTKKGVAEIDSWSLEGSIVAFVDGKNRDFEPRHFLGVAKCS